MLTSEIVTSIVDLRFDQAAAKYKKSGGASSNWCALIEAMLTLQSWSNECKLAEQSELLAMLSAATFSEWPSIIVEHDTGKSLACLMEANT